MEDSIQTVNPTPPTNGKKSRILLYFLGLIVLVLVGEGIVYLRQPERSGTSIQPSAVLPTISELPKTGTEVTQSPILPPEKTKTVVVKVFESTSEGEKIKLNIHEWTEFENKTSRTIFVSIRPGDDIDIAPDQVWGRSYEEPGKYLYEIIGLDKIIKGEIIVE